MKDKPERTWLILMTAAYLLFVLVDLILRNTTKIPWTSPRDFNDILSLIALGLLWIWHFVDITRKK